LRGIDEPFRRCGRELERCRADHRFCGLQGGGVATEAFVMASRALSRPAWRARRASARRLGG
jgi:hypothetical protein